MGVLRVMLAMSVVLSHLPPATFKFMSGALGVQAFFIVSGFYMSLVLSGKYADRTLFYTNRILRLAPTYFVMLVLAAIALFGFGITATAWPAIFETAYSNPLSAVILVFENIFVVGQDLLYWFKIAPDGGLYLDPAGGYPTEEVPIAWQALLVPQSWSLSMELLFYAMVPFLVRCGWRTLTAIVVASMALRFCGYLLPVEYGLWQGRFFPTVLFLFLLGMFAHRALPLASAAPKAVGWVAAAGAFALIVCLPMLGLPGEAGAWVIYLAITCTIPFIFNAFKDNKLDRWIGELSYPMYLSHLLIVALVLTFEPPFAAWVAILATFAVSALFLVLVDGPVDRWRQKRAKRARNTGPATESGSPSFVRSL